MSGIEHPPSLLGNFLISEFGFRLVFAMPIFGFVSIGLLFGVFVSVVLFLPFGAFAFVESFRF